MARAGRWSAGLLLAMLGCAPLPTVAPVPLPAVPVASGFLVGATGQLTLPEGWEQREVLPTVRHVLVPPEAQDTALAHLRQLPGVRFAEANPKLHLVTPVMASGFSTQAQTIPEPMVP